MLMLFFLQETHLALPDVPRLKHKLFTHVFHSSLNLKKDGTAILIKHTVAFSLIESILDPKGRFVILKCILNSSPYTLVSLYAPNTRQTTFLRSVLQTAKQLAHGKLLIAGDFNAVVDKTRDRSVGCARSALELRSLINEENLHDIWRYQHGNERDFTYFSSPRRTHSRIDMFLLDSSSLHSAQSSEIGYITWSDHAPISLVLSDTYSVTCRPPWRLNNFLLKSPTIVAEINRHLEEFFFNQHWLCLLPGSFMVCP